MRKSLVIAVAAATALAGVAPASAAPAARSAPAGSLEQVREGALASMRSGDLVEVRHHRRWGGHRGYRGHRSWRGGRHYGYRGYRGYRGHRHHRNRTGAYLGAAALGLATGAIIAGSANRGSSSCASRYRSYDPRSGTYLGYDGLRHPCR